MKQLELAEPPVFERRQVERRFLQYMQDRHGDVDLGSLCEVMWSAGGREAIQATARFGDILPQVAKIHGRLLELETVLMRLENWEVDA